MAVAVKSVPKFSEQGNIREVVKLSSKNILLLWIGELLSDRGPRINKPVWKQLVEFELR